MAVVRAFGMRVESLDEALSIPEPVRAAWRAYTNTVIQHYDMTWIDGRLKWIPKEKHDH